MKQIPVTICRDYDMDTYLHSVAAEDVQEEPKERVHSWSDLEQQRAQINLKPTQHKFLWCFKLRRITFSRGIQRITVVNKPTDSVTRT